MPQSKGGGAALDVLEAPLLRLPFDNLKRAAKERKSALDEAQEAAARCISQAQSTGSQAPAQQISQLIVSLQGLKRRLEEVSKQERDEASKCRARLEHLETLAAPKESMTTWNKQRMDRLLVDHLHRSGHYGTAAIITQEAHIEELVDSGVFRESKQIVEALKRHDAGPALEWCAANRARLRRSRSPLEFKLRCQEFVLLVKANQRMEAVQHARQHLAAWAQQYMQELQRVVTLLLFAGRQGAPAPYQALLQDSQWDALVALFQQELYRLHGLPPASPLLAHLQAGLSALKTPASYQPDCSKQDPLSSPALQQLAQKLPAAKHVHSQLLCSVTRTLMDHTNPPIVLPNGYVYSQLAVEQITAANGGHMVCPRTGSRYTQDELRRAYIA